MSSCLPGPGGHPATSSGVRIRLMLTAFSLVLLLLPAVAAGSGGPPDGFREWQVRGVRLLFKTPGAATQGAIFAVMRVGAAEQRADETHLAHVAEHMVFRNPLGDGRSLGQVLSEWGGTYNGWTGPYHTQFEIVVPDERIPEALGKLVEALFVTVVDEQAFGKEMSDRLERELRYMTTTPLAASLNAFRQQLFRGTPYEERLFEVPVTAVTAAGVAAFMAREYSPERLVVTVVAEVEEAALVEALTAALATVPSGKSPTQRQISLAPPPFERLSLRALDRPLIMVGLGFDGIEDEEDACLLTVAFGLVLSRVVPPPGFGLEPQLSGPIPLEGARYLAATFVADRRPAAADPERAAREALRAVRDAAESLAATGPHEGELMPLLQAREHRPALPSGVPPSLVEALLAGMTQLPGQYFLPPDFLAGLELPEMSTRIAETLRSYLPEAKPTVLVVTGTGGSLAVPFVAAGVLTLGAVLLGLWSGRGKRARRTEMR